MAGDFICIGDSICLYCEDTEGYVYSDQTSSNHGLYVYKSQEKLKPSGIPNPQVVTFTIYTPSRYKLTKKYRQLYEQDEKGLCTDASSLAYAKAAADAEHSDNVAEQKRLKGKRLRYGEIVQLKHNFTEKFILISTTDTSSVDKNKMTVFLDRYSSKNAQFRLVPKYKVKAESELVEVNDQIVLESVKSPGQFLHASQPYQIDFFHFGSELNLGIDQTAFSVIRYSCKVEEDRNIRGGSVIRLFHKDLEAYLVAEGVYGEPPTEDVHLRVREPDPMISRTLYPPRSGITYWQVEVERGILIGEPLFWNRPLRLCHMTTRQYLSVNKDLEVILTEDGNDPYSVFRFHNMTKKITADYMDSSEEQAMQYGCHVRIEHVLTGSWLHYPRGCDYHKRALSEGENLISSMGSLVWDGAELKQVAANIEQRYEDAFTIQEVEAQHILDFNYVAGFVPFLRNLIAERKKNIMTSRRCHQICDALKELKEFMIVKGKPKKDRQKLLRNLRVVDILVELVHCPLRGTPDTHRLSMLFKHTYQVLMTYLEGGSSKNSLYFAKYIDQYDSEAISQGSIGIQMAGVMIEVIKDNRKIVDRFTQRDIDKFIKLVINNRHSKFLEILGVLCVCRGIAMTDNQTHIAEELLEKNKPYLFHIEVGQDIGQTKDILFVSTDNRKSWKPFHTFVDSTSSQYVEEDQNFLNKQLDLFKLLCYGRNNRAIEIVTRNREFFTWEVAFCGLNSKFLNDIVKAKICDIVVALFVDVGGNFTIQEMASNNFVYGEIDCEEPDEKEAIQRNAVKMGSKDLDVGFPCLRLWLVQFFKDNHNMTATMTGRNVLIKEVLRLVHHLVMFGYISSSNQIQEIKEPLLHMLSGNKDFPYPNTVGIDAAAGEENETEGSMKTFQTTLDDIAEYRKVGRYTVKPGTESLVAAKLQALELLEILLCVEFNRRIKHFVALFKEAKVKESAAKRKMKSAVDPLLRSSFDPELDLWTKKKEQKMIFGKIEAVFKATALFDESLTQTLTDLMYYQSDDMVTKSVQLLNKYFTSKRKVFDIIARAQVLVSLESTRVHREVLQSMHTLRSLAKSSLNRTTVITMCTILSNYTGLCHVPRQPDQPHYIGQNILVNNGVLEIILDIVLQEVNHHYRKGEAEFLDEQYDISTQVISHALVLLRYLAQSNNKVKEFIFGHLDRLLSVRICGSDIALALKEAFVDRQINCLRIRPYQITKIIRLAAQFQHAAPEFFDLAKNLIKMNESGMILRRNQVLITKNIMENYSGAAYVMAMNADERLLILTQSSETHHLQYLIKLIDLLATCAEGENRYIESLCQTLLPLEEILNLLNNPDVNNDLKKPIVHYLVWAYMRTARSTEESGTDELSHNKLLWKFICSVTNLSQETVSTITKVLETRQRGSQFMILKESVEDESEKVFSTENNISYLIEEVMPFLQTFFGKFYEQDFDTYPEEQKWLASLSSQLLTFCEKVRPHIRKTAHIVAMMECMDTMLRLNSDNSIQELAAMMDRYQSFEKLRQLQSASDQDNGRYNLEEVALNVELQQFANNCIEIYAGRNDTAYQLQVKKGFRKKAVQKRYVDMESDSPLPLGREFQNHVSVFISPSAKEISVRYMNASRLVQQLGISACVYKRVASKEQEDVDIRSLQILRALLYNRIVLLPDNWFDNLNSNKSHLKEIEKIQNFLNDSGIVSKVLPLLSRQSNDIVREVLALMDTLFFNANKAIQKNILYYFQNTREEDFFFAVRNKLELTKAAVKEKRALDAQKRTRKLELSATPSLANGHVNKMAAEINVAPSVITTVSKKNEKMRELLSSKSVSIINTDLESEFSEPKKNEKSDLEFENPAFTIELEQPEVDIDSIEGYKDEGSIQLVLQVLAGMCDGQYRELQNYLRDQPDNIKTVNLVAEITQFLAAIYSHIDGSNIELTKQLFESMNEFCQGVQDNRAVILNNKIVDYVNFMLRAGRYEGCAPEQVFELWSAIGNLVYSMIEESSPEAYAVAKDIQQTLDMEAVYRVMTECNQIHQNRKADIYVLTHCVKPEYMDAKQMVISSEMKENAWNTGFLYFIILAKMYDIEPQMDKFEALKILPEEKKAYKYYKTNSMSVELIKDDHLQRRYFKVKNKALLREDLKENVKWNIDRSSSRTKLRELVLWSRDIVNDIHYQKTILKNPIVAQLAKRWTVWNYLCIIQSLVIQIMMIVSYVAPGMREYADLDDKAPLPKNIYNIYPEISWGEFDMFLLIIGISHNFCSLMLFICYLLLYHPRLPKDSDLKLVKNIVNTCFPEKEDPLEKKKEKDNNEEQGSKLDATLFSFTTLYYLALFACSVAGTFTYGYLYAFHLLNIVANNQLLQGVIKAVTQNGKSLLWVGILGLIVLYLYALVGFAFFKPVFNPSSEYYCNTLAQCYLTTIRYGLIGDLNDMRRDGREENFTMFAFLVIYQISFFIIFTTIGLNVIFGIIVDTFSELRDVKWAAEKDMQNTCFICSRDAYEFEHTSLGFQHHVQNEHNMWAYVFYFNHLHDTKRNDYSALDMYVANQMDQEKLEFFPLDRAICLDTIPEDSTESKVDEIMETVNKILLKQHDDDYRRSRNKELERQKKWQEQHSKEATPRQPPVVMATKSTQTDDFPPRRDGSAAADQSPPPTSLVSREPPQTLDETVKLDEGEEETDGTAKKGDESYV